MKNTSSILLVVQFFFVSVLLGIESDANLTALPIQSVGLIEMEVPSMASKNPKKPNLTAIVGSKTGRSEEHTSELSHTVISYAVFCLKKKKKRNKKNKNKNKKKKNKKTKQHETVSSPLLHVNIPAIH